jgi:hypothetical protein
MYLCLSSVNSSSTLMESRSAIVGVPNFTLPLGPLGPPSPIEAPKAAS